MSVTLAAWCRRFWPTWRWLCIGWAPHVCLTNQWPPPLSSCTLSKQSHLYKYTVGNIFKNVCSTYSYLTCIYPIPNLHCKIVNIVMYVFRCCRLLHKSEVYPFKISRSTSRKLKKSFFLFFGHMLTTYTTMIKIGAFAISCSRGLVENWWTAEFSQYVK